MKFNITEFSGGLGDLGTFIPLVASLIAVCDMDGGSILFFAGLFNILTGLIFNQPVPVQPMKAIAAVAIAEGLMPGEIAAAGFSAGLIVFILGISGLVVWVEKLVPRPVVRGIQLGVGLKLAVKGIAFVTGTQVWGLDSQIIAFVAAALILATRQIQKFPVALVIFIGGLLLMFLGNGNVFKLGWDGPQFILPTISQWQSGFFNGTLPQVPLTLLNSVIAVCALSGDYFPKKAIPVKNMATSVGLMNLFGCLLGAMPVCHGSGGLAAQYRFGARTGGSVIMLGAVKILIALLFGAAAISILKAYPISILGVLLVFSGLELTLPARNCIDKESFFVMIATAGGILAANTGVGFLLGFLVALFLLKKRNIA